MNVIIVSDKLIFFIIRRIIDPRFFPLEFSQRKKEKKESPRISGGFKISRVFLKKYYLNSFQE